MMTPRRRAVPGTLVPWMSSETSTTEIGRASGRDVLEFRRVLSDLMMMDRFERLEAATRDQRVRLDAERDELEAAVLSDPDLLAVPGFGALRDDDAEEARGAGHAGTLDEQRDEHYRDRKSVG